MRWASSQMTRSHSGAASSLAFSSSERAAMSSRTISRLRSTNGLPVTEASIWSRVSDVEAQAELLGQLVLPLLDEAAGRDDQAALEIAADQQLLDQQPGHDRLAGAGIVGEQEAQRLARQHLAVDGGDLVRQRLDLRRADREVGVEQMRESDAIGLGRQAQQAAVGIEGVGPASFEKLERCLFAAIKQPLADAAVRPEDKVQGVGAEMRDLNDLSDAGRVKTPQPGTCLSDSDGGARLQLLECQSLCSRARGRISSRELAVQGYQLRLELPGNPQIAGIVRGQPRLGSKVKDRIMINGDLFHPEPVPQVKHFPQRLALRGMPPALKKANIRQLEAEERRGDKPSAAQPLRDVICVGLPEQQSRDCRGINNLNVHRGPHG